MLKQWRMMLSAGKYRPEIDSTLQRVAYFSLLRDYAPILWASRVVLQTVVGRIESRMVNDVLRA